MFLQPQQRSTFFIMPLQISEPRTLLQKLPPPYNEEISPYSAMKDFPQPLRYELEIMRRKFKLRPCKVIFVGDVAAGKTAMVSRFCYDKFRVNYKATIGVDFEIETFNILGHNITLEMWDTAGQERFKCIAQAYYRNANVVVVVFDMSKLETLENAKTWLRSAMAVNSTKQPLIFLVGTKSDLLSQDEFIRVEKSAGNVASSINAEYWSVSARTGYKIVEFFQRLSALAFEMSLRAAIQERNNYEKQSSIHPQGRADNLALGKYYGYDNEKARQASNCAC